MEWRKWIKPVVLMVYIILLCIALPLCFWELNKKNAPANIKKWFISGLFAMGAIPISLWTILEHLINYTKPYLQRHIIRILWMVPIYALNAWFALRFPRKAIYLDTLRECYEAYVIYNFMVFLLSFLRHEYPELGYMIEQKPQVKHLIPLCCCPPWPMGKVFIDRCRHGTLQYAVIRPFTTCIALICELAGVYGEGSFDYRKAYVYLMVINNVSQVWAMYCLILFYKCAREELSPMRPVWKFICVKFVVFMSFWQGILLTILYVAHVIPKTSDTDGMSTSIEIQNIAICIEMFIAAIAHHFSFSHKPYIDPNAPSIGCCTSCWTMWDVSDFRRDVVEHVKHVGDTVRSTLTRPGTAGRAGGFRNTERSPLIAGSGAESDASVTAEEWVGLVSGSYGGSKHEGIPDGGALTADGVGACCNGDHHDNADVQSIGSTTSLLLNSVPTFPRMDGRNRSPSMANHLEGSVITSNPNVSLTAAALLPASSTSVNCSNGAEAGMRVLLHAAPEDPSV